MAIYHHDKVEMARIAVGTCDVCGRRVWDVRFIGGPCNAELPGYSYDRDMGHCSGTYRGINVGVLIEMNPRSTTVLFLVHIMLLQHRGSTPELRARAEATVREFSLADAVQLLTHIYMEVIPVNAQEMDAARGLLRQSGYTIVE
ncbi:MAG TPA: hypothetical protein VNL77_13900 [Roseiflexaceae bacterium]|nr:hypothetical protein [Roseiflexaceae bacterium]